MTKARELADFARVLPARRFEDGSAATPGIGFTSQINTGLFRPATSVLALSVNGTERLRASTTGVNVVGDLTVGGSPVYARTNLLGTVSQTSGVPTGAVIQRGSNANGEFVRFADGTQLCTAAVTVTGNYHVVTSASTAATFVAGTMRAGGCLSESDAVTVNLTSAQLRDLGSNLSILCNTSFGTRWRYAVNGGFSVPTGAEFLITLWAVGRWY